MPAYPVLRFVNSIAATPTVDLDLNLGQPFTTRHEEFTVGAPSYSGDPLSVGVKWGYRTLTLVTQASGANTTALAAYSALAKQVTVDNLLMFQLDSATPPVFFKTYQTQPSEIDLSNVEADSGDSYWRLSVQLTADADAIGLPETGTVTIANDPAAATNPCFYWFGSDVKGDLETELYLEAPASDVRGQTRLLSSQALVLNTPVAGSPTNKVTNPSFETDVSNWTLVANETLTRLVPTAGAKDGSAVGVLASTGATDAVAYSNEFATTPGQIFSAAVYAKWKTGTPRSAWVGIQWLNAAHAPLSDSTGSTVLLNTTSWQQLTVLNKTAPASTAFCRMWFWTLSTVAGEEAMYDAAQLENSATLPAYNPARLAGPVLVQANTLTHNVSGIINTPAPAGTLVDNTGDAAMAGGNYTRYTTNAGDGAGVALLYGSNLLPGSLVGDYRVLMRGRASHASGGWQFYIVVLSGTSLTYSTLTGDVVNCSGPTTGPHWFDMGVFRFPFGAPQIDPVGAFDTAYANPGLSFAIVMKTRDTTAAHTFDFDCLLFVPVGLDQASASRYATTAYDKSLPGTTYKAVWNGPTDNRYLLDTSSNYSPGIAPVADGGLPTLVPGADNSIHYLQHIGTGYNDPRTGVTTGTNDALTNTTALTWKYWPKYLWLRPAGG